MLDSGNFVSLEKIESVSPSTATTSGRTTLAQNQTTHGANYTANPPAPQKSRANVKVPKKFAREKAVTLAGKMDKAAAMQGVPRTGFVREKYFRRAENFTYARHTHTGDGFR